MTNVIIKNAKTGNPAAIAELYEQYRAEGLNVARKYVKNRDDAEDMYQDAFLKAITNIDSFDETRDFGPWFKTIIANTCKNFLVKKKAVNFSEMSDEENEFVDTLGSTDDDTVPELTYDRKEFIKIMDGIINELPQAQREAVALFYYKEMSIKEIARLQEVPEDTVKSRLNYSRKKVGAAVEEYEKKTGTKLYGAIIIPVMFTLFYRNSVYAAEADMLLADVMGDAASAPVASSSGPEAGSATHRIATQRVKNVSSSGVKKAGTVGTKSAVAGAMGKTLAAVAVKVIIPVVSVAVIGATAYKVVEDKVNKSQQETVEQTVENEIDMPEEITEPGNDEPEIHEENEVQKDIEVPEDEDKEHKESKKKKKKDEDPLVYDLDSDGTLVISGKGELKEFWRVRNYNAEIEKVRKIIIKDEVTVTDDIRAGKNMFHDLEYLETVELPQNMTRIHTDMFADCPSLRSISIPDGVTVIGEGAFSRCRSLRSVELPDSVVEIQNLAFYVCESLEEVNIPDSVTSIGESAFCECISLKSLVFPDSVTEIKENLCYDCKSLEKVVLGNKTRKIGNMSFGNCKKLRSINIPDTVEEVSYKSAFSGCRELNLD